MEGNILSSPQPESQALTATPSSPPATRTTRRTIQDYFATSSPITRQNSLSDGGFATDEPTASSQSINASEERPKKFKITANNGQAIITRQPGRKKVKKEATFDGIEQTRINQSRRYNSRAKLRMLPLFPLDVIFEIFSHLLPVDLLHLIRTTKDIRAILLHRSASYVWKSALANVPDLPRRPDEVTLPRWAHLAFDTFCQNCLAPNVRSVNFDLRVRYCNKCVKIKLLAEYTFNPQKNPKDEIILRGVPFSRWNERFDGYCTIDAKDEFLREYESRRGDTASFMKERIEALKLRKEHAKKCKAWFDGLLDLRGAELDEIRENRAKSIMQKLESAGFKEELDFLTLLARGSCAVSPYPWRTVLFNDHPHVKIPKPLTEKAWGRIEDDMFDYMTEISALVTKNTRALIERKRRVAFHTAYVNWRCLPQNLRRFRPDSLMPGPADVLHEIRRWVEKEGDEEYDLTTATKMLEDRLILPDFITSWRRNIILDLFETSFYITSYRPRFAKEWPRWTGWNSTGPRFEEREEWLKSAVVVFQCDHDSTHWQYELARKQEESEDHIEASCMWYPEFFFHPCTAMTHFSMDEKFASDNKNLSLAKQFSSMRRDKWDVERLKFDERASRTVSRLLESAGLENTVTVEELDKLNHRFVCLKCTFGARCDGSRKVRVWSWRDAVQHCLKTHFGDSRVTWECLYPEDTEKALALEAVEHTKRGYPAPDACKMWKCVRCRDTSSESRRMTMAELRAHFVGKPKHGDVNDTDGGENVLYYLAHDYSPKELAPVKMAPSANKPMKSKRPLTWFEKMMRAHMNHPESP